MPRNQWLTLCAALLLCFVAVSAGNTQSNPEALRNAPDAIEMDGVAVQLEAEVWRDFMPTAYPDEASRLQASATGPGQPMTARLRIRVRNGQQIPPGVSVDVAWVIWNDRIWESRPSEDLPRDAANQAMSLYLENGPKWPPGATVDIVVRVVDAAGVAHLLSSRGQKIHAAA